jgi:hypothetical protein
LGHSFEKDLLQDAARARHDLIDLVIPEAGLRQRSHDPTP